MSLAFLDFSFKKLYISIPAVIGVEQMSLGLNIDGLLITFFGILI